MVVYWEYAFLENTLIDGLLLYLALKCARQKIPWMNLVFAALVGGAEAVAFPLLTLPVWASYLVKILGGVLIAIFSVRRGRLKTYLVVIAAFFAFTFALGGLLTAIYSFFGVECIEGQGYMIESAPVGLILAGAGIFFAVSVVLIKRAFAFRKVQQSIAHCTLVNGTKKVQWRGLVDSGNMLSFRGSPVNVLSPIAALALFGRGAKGIGRMRVKTANGERERPVFACGQMTVRIQDSQMNFENVFFTTGDVGTKDYQMVLHTAFTEDRHENIERAHILAAKDKGE